MLMFLTLCGITRLVLMKFFSSSIKAVLLLCFFYIYFASYHLMPKLSTLSLLQDLL